jgi:hypothetical protein
LDSKDSGRPFDRQYEIPFSYAKEMAFFQQQYWTPADATDNWRLIDSDWLGGSSELALQLDSLSNNTRSGIGCRGKASNGRSEARRSPGPTCSSARSSTRSGTTAVTMRPYGTRASNRWRSCASR